MSIDALPEWPPPRERPQREDVYIYRLTAARALAEKGPVKVFALYADGRGFRLITITEWYGDEVRNAVGRRWRVVGEVWGPEIAKLMGYVASWPHMGTPCAVEVAA